MSEFQNIQLKNLFDGNEGERMSSRRIALFVAVVVLIFAGVRAGLAKPGADETSPFAGADAKILAEIHDMNSAPFVSLTHRLRTIVGPDASQASAKKLASQAYAHARQSLS